MSDERIGRTLFTFFSCNLKIIVWWEQPPMRGEVFKNIN
jgi:hypothetical protein